MIMKQYDLSDKNILIYAGGNLQNYWLEGNTL